QLPGIRERSRSAPQDPSRIGERFGATLMADPVPSPLLWRLATRRQFLKAASTAALAPAVLTATGCGPFGSQTASKTGPTTHDFVTRPDLKPPLITTTATGPTGSGLIFITANGPLIVDNNGSPIWYQ